MITNPRKVPEGDSALAPIDVLHIGISFFPYNGGSSVRLGTLLENQPGVRSHVVTHTAGEESSGNGAAAIIRLKSYFTLSGISKLHRLAKALQPAAVVLHNPRIMLLWITLVDPFHRIPRVAEIHSFRDQTAVTQRLSGILYRRMDAVVVLARVAVDYCARVYGLPRERLHVIRNGAPVLSPATAERPPRDQRCTVLYMGTFYDWQGVEIIAEAALLLDGIFFKKARIVMAGGGPKFDVIAARLAPLVEKGHVALPGWVSKKESERMLSSSAIVLMPRISNLATEFVLPLKVFEAMKHAKAIIASRVGGLLEVLKEDRTAVFVAPGDPQDLARQIRRLVDDPALRERLGAASAADVDHYETWRDSGTAYEQLFRMLAANRASSSSGERGSIQ